MNKRRRLSKATANTTANKIKLPPKVTIASETLTNGRRYVFSHTELGELGHMTLEDLPSGECHIAVDVAGDAADPMFEQRRALFEPLVHTLIAAVDVVDAVDTPSQDMSSLPPVTQNKVIDSVPVETVPCQRCGAPLAFLVFVNDAKDASLFEDYARMLYASYSQYPIPTYLIGPPSQRDLNGNLPAPVFKVWPERAPIETMTPEAFRQRLDRLTCKHCGQAESSPFVPVA